MTKRTGKTTGEREFEIAIEAAGRAVEWAQSAGDAYGETVGYMEWGLGERQGNTCSKAMAHQIGTAGPGECYLTFLDLFRPLLPFVT